MYRRKLLPYIIEMIVCVLVFACVIGMLFITNSVRLIWTPLLVIVLLFLIVWLVSYVTSFIWLAVLVVIDMICHDFHPIKGKFVEQLVYRSSSFLDKNGTFDNCERIEKIYYKVVVQTDAGIQILTSSEYYLFEQGKIYFFMIGRRSKVLVDIIVWEDRD